MDRQPHITKRMVTTHLCCTDLVIYWLLTVNLGKRPDCENLQIYSSDMCFVSDTSVTKV